MGGKYSKFLTILLIVIILGVIGLVGYLIFDFFKNSTIDQEAAEYVSTFTDTTEHASKPSDAPTQQNTITDNSENKDEEIKVEEIDKNQSSSSSSNKKKSYKGFDVIGTIQIPKTNISYPVLEKPTRKALEVAVASLYPRDAVLNSKGNVVIIGHNYRNGKFFSNNKNLSNGDKIYITDLDGNKVTYIIYKTFQTDENDTSFYNRDTNGAREITLSTCTDDSTARTIILAKAQGD